MRNFGLLLWILTSSPPWATQESQIRVEVEAVNVLVTVTDRDGRFITDLPKERFIVAEDGVQQKITNFARETSLPLRIGLLIDTSSSVRLKLDFEKRAATNFLYSVMKEKDEALLVEFDQGVSLVRDFTGKPGEIVKELKRLRAGGGTALLDAIYKVSHEKMTAPQSRQTIIVVSDGQDLNSSHTLKEAVQTAQGNGVVIYAIGTSRFGASPDREGDEMLESLVEQTGGRAFFPYSAEMMSEAFEVINQELRSQYSLTYVPTNKKRDGKFRKIEVKLDDGKRLNVRYRQGYWAPG